ncbi:cellulose binding domain-containing protein [Saccharothrix carnea]|uniref:Cellulose binding domain-containing protein n=1 Tax=Saccharothrix carnea TaxID=1280637 RepID=A0A2P8I242_SACCR|nr:cellulose binding domain-containing protein [Saccharothrix carnea]PSL52531.1 cellulose binding domain-containing protein [Saccharothrix carnea]
MSWSYANGQRTTQLWGGTLVSSGPVVTVTNAGWNGSPAPGASTALASPRAGHLRCRDDVLYGDTQNDNANFIGLVIGNIDNVNGGIGTDTAAAGPSLDNCTNVENEANCEL